MPQKDIEEALNKIVIPPPPYAIDPDGAPYFTYSEKYKKYLVDPAYFMELVQYQYDTEAAAQALEELKK